MRSSERVAGLQPYLFAAIQHDVAAKRASGIDLINLGIGDPDTPTYPPIVAAAQRAVADPGCQGYPSHRGRVEFREALTRFYDRRFGVGLDADTEVMAAIGAKECIFNLNLAFLDPGDVALAADPGYATYTVGPRLVGGEVVLMPLVAERGFGPDVDAIDVQTRRRARLLFVNYPNNPTGAVVPDGLFEQLVAFGVDNDILIVHDNPYSETTFDGYVAPSFLATPGAMDVGVEVFSLSKGCNMTGWRCAAILGNADAIGLYWRLKTNIDSGLFDAVQLAGAQALAPELDVDRAEMAATYARRRDLVCGALGALGIDVTPPRGTIYVWAPVPAGFVSSVAFCEHVLERAHVVLFPGAAYGSGGEGFFRISLTSSDEHLGEALGRLGALG
jgi:LL-diaminopimelate aminotransferase